MEIKPGDVFHMVWADGFDLGAWECQDLECNSVANGVMLSGAHQGEQYRFTSELLESMKRIWREGDAECKWMRSGVVSEGL
jgi:hypothetical protein